MTTFAIYSIKGGVGKTAAAVNLAYLSSNEGRRTLLWDLDPQGAASFYFNIKPKVKGGTKKLLKSKNLDNFIKQSEHQNLDILPADESYRNLDLELDDLKKSHKKISLQLELLKDEYDTVFLDAPPSFSLLSENIFIASDYLLTPVIPTTLSVRTHNQLLNYFKERGIKASKILPFFSMVDRRKKLHLQTIKENLVDASLKNIIPYSSVIEKMGLFCSPVAIFSSSSFANIAYNDLWEEIKISSKIAHHKVLPKIFGVANS